MPPGSRPAIAVSAYISSTPSSFSSSSPHFVGSVVRVRVEGPRVAVGGHLGGGDAPLRLALRQALIDGVVALPEADMRGVSPQLALGGCFSQWSVRAITK